MFSIDLLILLIISNVLNCINRKCNSLTKFLNISRPLILAQVLAHIASSIGLNCVKKRFSIKFLIKAQVIQPR